MNWYTLKAEFKKEYPDYTVKVDPPCISDTRYTHYYYEVLAYVLGKKFTIQGCVDVDETTKTITLYR